MTLTLTFWGTRGSIPSPGPHTTRYGGNTPCVELRSATGALLILDAGTGIRHLGRSRRERSKGTPIVADILLSHAHWDHDAGSAALKKATGAQYMVMDSDVPVVQSGGKEDFQYWNQPNTMYPPAKVDRVLHDGDTVKLGNMTLTAHKTPGHTKGCTTWTMKVVDG